jgi:hypothetical protein
VVDEDGHDLEPVTDDDDLEPVTDGDNMEATEAALQAERDAFAEAASEDAPFEDAANDILPDPPEIQGQGGGRLGSVSVEMPEPEVPEREWSDLSLEEKADVFFSAIGELESRIALVEQNLMILGQAFVKAIETTEGPIQKRMDMPGQHASYRTRSSR